ncbi:MAG: hypothetical protein KatS3mg034_1162 [Vicingaceae bacterium]|nr:MAG: hypothetical protein KatS3mg034_1162 [Vicingaceae bacterium]
MFEINIHILQIIKELLFEKECLIIPGWGGFIKNSASAHYDKFSSLLFPPSENIIFNPELKHQDGFLVLQIAQKLNLTYEQAGRLLKDQIEEWNKIINTYHRLSFDGIGTFFKTINGTVIFEQDKHFNYSKRYFGLTPVQMTPVFQKTPILELNNYRQNIKKNQTANTKIWRIAIRSAASVLLLATIYLTSKYVPKEYVYQASLQLKNIVFKEKVKYKPNHLISSKISNNHHLKEENESLQIFSMNKTKHDVNEGKTDAEVNKFENNENKQSTKYYVVAGTFNSQKNALGLENKLKKSGYSSLVIERKGKYTVAYKEFNDKNKAMQYLLQEIRPKHPQAWILTYEKN